MMGNLLKITVGNYFNNMPGILTSINLKPNFEAGWDINRKETGEILYSVDGDLNVGQLLRMIDVPMAFTPIHYFTPQYNQPFINDPEGLKRSSFGNSEPIANMPPRPIPRL